MQPMIIPDYVMTIDDYTGLNRIMTDLRFGHANRHIAAKGRTLPCRHARRFICIEIIGRRGICHEDQPDVSKAIDRHQRLAPRPRVPAGDTQQVPHQPWPEQRPDMGKVALEVRMHARKDEAAPCQTNSDHPSRVIPESPQGLSGTFSLACALQEQGPGYLLRKFRDDGWRVWERMRSIRVYLLPQGTGGVSTGWAVSNSMRKKRPGRSSS